jgi:hypothetical protein
MDLWENGSSSDRLQIEQTARDKMRQAARECILEAMTTSMFNGSWTVLELLGIDSKKLFLESFQSELKTLIYEEDGYEPKEEG